VSPDGAGHDLTCRLAVLVVAACGLAWALHLRSLAPRQAPRDLVINANVRMLRAGDGY
jgi:hypothetical protein